MLNKCLICYQQYNSHVGRLLYANITIYFIIFVFCIQCIIFFQCKCLSNVQHWKKWKLNKSKNFYKFPGWSNFQRDTNFFFSYFRLRNDHILSFYYSKYWLYSVHVLIAWYLRNLEEIIKIRIGWKKNEVQKDKNPKQKLVEGSEMETND